MTAEARTLTAADVYLRTEQPWTDAVLRAMRERLAVLPNAVQTETIDIVTMARLPGDEEIRCAGSQ